MLKLFKIEWLKINTYRTFWVLFGTFVVFFPLTVFFSASKYMEQTSGARGSGPNPEDLAKALIGAPFVFPKIWQTSAWFGGHFFVIIGMLFVMLITNEVQYRTHRQNIIDGWSRLDFLRAKASVMFFFVIAATLLVFITGIITGLAFSAPGADLFEDVHYVAYFALMAFHYLLIGFFIAILVKRTGLAVIVYFISVYVIDGLLWLLLTIRGNQMGYFLPFETVDALIPSPFTPEMMKLRTVADYTLLISTAVYVSLFTYLIVNRFKNADLKT
ncbi:ABC transporter permease [Terrimonas ferruginea]|uniref:ABC transporter permease n=1 Tax=Terrimonas ferruginea TaxID=249 RepID=UPI000414F456|nr:ABC transporter permease [Terrimonas ferruginea]